MANVALCEEKITFRFVIAAERFVSFYLLQTILQTDFNKLNDKVSAKVECEKMAPTNWLVQGSLGDLLLGH